jgi:hypothetical protein
MRTLLVPALAALLALPAFASAQSPATAPDDAGVARRDPSAAARAAPVQVAHGNAFDDADLRFAEVVETAPAPLRVAGNATEKPAASCSCHR